MNVNFNILSLKSYYHDALDPWASSSMAFAKQEGYGLKFECCLYQFIANLKKERKIYDALTSQSIFSNNKKHWAETRMHVCFHAQGKAMSMGV